MFESNSSQRVRYMAIVALSIVGIYLMAITEFRFLDPLSILIVVGGTCLAGLVSYDFEDLKFAIYESIHSKKIDSREFDHRIEYFAELAAIKKTKGNVSMEDFAKAEYDSMIKKGLQLIADGISVEEIRKYLLIDYRIIIEKKRYSIKILNQLAAVAPAAGLIGTVVGLIQMLSLVSNSSQLSHGLSVSLLTTLYGAIISYLFLQPLANKLESHIEGEDMLLDLTVEGIVAIASGYAPQLLRERLESFAS